MFYLNWKLYHVFLVELTVEYTVAAVAEHSIVQYFLVHVHVSR